MAVELREVAAVAGDARSAPARILTPAAGYWLAVVGALCVGVVLRLGFVLPSDFPLNDGGMFYAMVRDLQQAHYALPWYTSYNGGHIPFAYPPLGFYLAATLADLTGWSLIAIFRFLPLTLSALTIVAFARLSRTMLRSMLASACAVFAFALLPMSYLWTIMGGGLTRALGLLFALLTLDQVYRLYTTRAAKYIPLAILCAAGVVLSHPEAAWFAAYSSVFFFLWVGRHRQGLVHSGLVAVGTVALTAPWWVTISLRHGPALLNAFGDSGTPLYDGVFQLLLLTTTHEQGFPIIGMLAILGLLASLRQRRYFVPLWLLVVCLLQMRAPTQKAVVPLALLAGSGLADVLLPLLNAKPLQRLAGQWRQTAEQDVSQPRMSRRASIVGAFILLYAIFANFSYFNSLTALSPAERAAMQWVAGNTPATSMVLVISTRPEWANDAVSEWFPILAARPSVATVQGDEWLGHFSRFTARYAAAQHCGIQSDPACLLTWAHDYHVAFDYVYITTPGQGSNYRNTAPLLQGMTTTGQYTRVYDGPGAAVYHRTSAAP
jgi:hypothetical protein